MDVILKYFPDLSEHKILQFEKLYPLYSDWNSKINVISRKDIDHLYERHILHSLSIAKIIQFKKGTSVLDVGTGGGLPGIPLAILFPEVNFFLVDSIGKKIKVVEAITESLGLKNVTFEQNRAENLKGKYDFTISRAVTTLPEFLNWTLKLISKNSFNDLVNGVLYLKGGDLSKEVGSVGAKHYIFDLNNLFDEEFFKTKKLVYLYDFQ